MKKHKIHLRIYILVALVLTLPILLNVYSPIIMVWGIRNGIITTSVLIFIVWFMLSLFMGRSVSCGYTCPYGALQEILGIYVLKKKPKSEKANKIRYFVFVIFLLQVSFLIFNIGVAKNIDLFASNGNLQLIILITITTIIIGLLSILLGSRAFCRYICPQGVFLTIGSKLGRKIKIPSLQLKSNYHNCSNCKLCDKSCPMGLDVNQMVINSTMDDLNCILCGECIEKCPKDAISYSYGAKD
ncbi:MAG: 4Fe-4S binding protein [Methanobacteriaceae archaeon]|jgi:polyferredoxin|nr:4Fe-4S binding protein [Methanobacteriaceae archaeon]